MRLLRLIRAILWPIVACVAAALTFRSHGATPRSRFRRSTSSVIA